MIQSSKTLALTDWLKDLTLEIENKSYCSDVEKMELAIKLSRLNVEYQTGGPFGAVVFSQKNHQIVGLGVNRVVPENASIAHAEIMALTLAQENVKHYDLGSDGAKTVLVSSAQPCVMCYGAMLWSGIKKLIYGATSEDVEGIVGFDEGPIHPNWIEEAIKRGIQIQGEVLRDEAVRFLKLYKQKGGLIYNC